MTKIKFVATPPVHGCDGECQLTPAEIVSGIERGLIFHGPDHRLHTHQQVARIEKDTVYIDLIPPTTTPPLSSL